MSAKFIDFLRNWGESLFTSKKAYISNQAMPSTSSINVDIGSAGTISNQFVAPETGYMIFNGTTQRLGQQTQMWNSGNFNPKATAPNSTSIVNWLPVAKGQVISFYYDTGMTDITIRFFRSIGGGINQILQAIGGGLCHLSHSFNRFLICSLRKLSLVTTCKNQILSGSAIKHCHNYNKHNTMLQAPARLLPRLTELLAYISMAHQRQQSKTQESHHQTSTPLSTVQRTMVCDIFVNGFQSLKVATSAFRTLAQERLRSDAIRQLAAGQSRLSFAQGGAL